MKLRSNESSPELPAFARILKRSFDVVAAIVALLLLAPLLAAIAYAVSREGGGPVLFRQAREGYQRSLFRIFKFRTMVPDAEASGGFRQARQRDPRVTRTGAFLRRSSFDELPQIFNVLTGDMSIVGPRPHVPQLSEEFAHKIDSYYERLNTRPGITGLAQVSGLRGETETLDRMEQRVRRDIEYIHRWSLTADLSICVQTVRTAIGEDAAY